MYEGRRTKDEEGTRTVLVLLASILFLCPSAFVLRTSATSATSAQTFKARVDLVWVTASVVDANGRLIKGLAREDFKIWEDGDEQPISQFTDERVPVSLGVLLDASDSMRGQPIID